MLANSVLGIFGSLSKSIQNSIKNPLSSDLAKNLANEMADYDDIFNSLPKDRCEFEVRSLK